MLEHQDVPLSAPTLEELGLSNEAPAVSIDSLFSPRKKLEAPEVED